MPEYKDEVEIQWMSYDRGAFREVARTRAAGLKDALERIREGYPDARIADDDPMDGTWRIVAKSAGGRAGRNVAFVELTWDRPDQQLDYEEG